MLFTANLWLKISGKVAGSSQKLASYFKNKATNATGGKSKLKIILSEDDIKLEYASKKDTQETVWGHFYQGAGIFLEGNPEEIEVDREALRKERFRVQRTADIKPLLGTNLWNGLFGFSQSNPIEDNKKLIMIAGGLIIGYMMLQEMGMF